MAEEDDDNDFPEEEVLSAGQCLQASALSRVKWIGLDVSTTQETFDKESLVGKKLSVFRLSEEQSRLEVSGRGDWNAHPLYFLSELVDAKING